MVVAHQLSSNSSNTSIAKSPEKPQPMDVQSMAPPPFLIKTYDMVDDPSTDSIVSWNAGGNGFVVWNSNEFQKEMLPKFFKHNNFSSFVRQLNTYGFRKVDPDRWEFANEGFLKGQKQLLRGIHRRKPASHTHQQQVQAAQPQSKPACVEVGKFGIEGEIDRLKRDKNVLMAELVRLRQHQQQTDRDLSMVLQRLHVTEQRQQQMISFLAKAMQSPSFLAQLVQQNENKKRLATARKKRRLPKRDNDTETVVVDEGSSSPVEGQIVKYQPNSNDPVSMFMQYLNSPAAELSAKMDLPNLEVTFRDLDGKQEGGGGGAGGFALAGMHSARMMGDLSPSRLMKDMADSLSLSDAEMQVAPASPLSLMRFENLEEDGGDSSLGIEQQQGEGEGDGEGGGDEGNSLLEDMATADDFEWDQFLIQAGVDIDAADGELPLWDENGDNVDELTQQIQQL